MLTKQRTMEVVTQQVSHICRGVKMGGVEMMGGGALSAHAPHPAEFQTPGIRTDFVICGKAEASLFQGLQTS